MDTSYQLNLFGLPDQADIRPFSAVQQEFQMKLDEGAHCPCCHQFAKTYRRKIHSSMARDLIGLYLLPSGYHYVRGLQRFSSGGDFAKLAYWELIEEATEPVTRGGKTSGMWRTTERGRLFARGAISVPKLVILYNQRVLGFCKEQATIQDALGDRFSFSALMEGSL